MSATNPAFSPDPDDEVKFPAGDLNPTISSDDYGTDRLQEDAVKNNVVVIENDPELSYIGSSAQPSLDELHRRTGVHVARPVYTQPEFDEAFDNGGRPDRYAGAKIWRSFRKCCSCSTRVLMSTFPFIDIMRNYNFPSDLVNDIISGLTVGIMHIPQGMAYSLLASLPPYYGLYVSFFPVLVYYFFGTSKHVSLGTFAVISLMVGTSVDGVCGEAPGDGSPDPSPNATGNASTDDFIACQVGAATAVTFLAGMIQIAMGILHLGFVTIYLSEPLTRGFTTGASIHVFTSQVKHVFGISTARYSGPLKLIYTYRDTFKAIPTTNPVPVITSVVCMAVLFFTKEYLNPPVKRLIRAPIPVELLVVIFGTLVSSQLQFESKFGMTIVGYIPRGIPPPQAPHFNVMGQVAGDAVAIAVVAFAISISMSTLFAQKHSYEVDANQELLAHGICNVFGSFFNCYQACVSLSRSLVQENVGGRTQVAGLVSCVLLLIVLLALAHLFQALPNCVLAAIIIIALKGMFLQFKDVPRYWRISKTDLSIWLVTFVAVFLLDVALGLLVGVGWSLLTVVGRTQRPYTCLLGNIPGTATYVDLKSYTQAREIKGVKVFQIQNSLYYANADYFLSSVYRRTGCNPRTMRIAWAKVDRKIAAAKKKASKRGEELDLSLYPRPEPDIHHVVLDCSTMGWLDAVGSKTLSTVISEYQKVGVVVFLSECKDGTRESLVKGGVFASHSKDLVYPTTHDAIMDSLRGYPELQREMQSGGAFIGKMMENYYGYEQSDLQGSGELRNGAIVSTEL